MRFGELTEDRLKSPGDNFPRGVPKIRWEENTRHGVLILAAGLGPYDAAETTPETFDVSTLSHQILPGLREIDEIFHRSNICIHICIICTPAGEFRFVVDEYAACEVCFPLFLT